MRILPCGPRARLIEHADPPGYAAAVRSASLPGLLDVVTAEHTVLVTFQGGAPDGALSTLEAQAPDTVAGAQVEIPVVYDGQDLDDVARATGLTPAGVIAAHAGAAYRVGFCGFAPGFAYLLGLDPRLGVPRRDTPRTRVPAGSVAIAAGYSAVYPLASPGGWHLLGRTDMPVFDPMRADPALLMPGMRVRFVPVDHLAPPHPAPALTHGLMTSVDPVVEVLQPGPLTLVQDLGRPGHGAIAVGESGAFDRGAHRLGNRIAGNAESAATLEAIGGGLTLRAARHCVAVITGAEGPVTVDDRPADRGAPLALAPGQVLRLGTPRGGVRSYVALRGGVSAAPVLGSVSRDTLCGLGPAPIVAGARVGVGAATGPIVVDHVPAVRSPRDLVLRLHPGPRRDRLAPEGRSALTSAGFTVSPDSDRIGVRLSGPRLALAAADRLASEGVVRGSVQVPPDGRPVILGPDHPVTGGYPVIGVVDDADLDQLAQAGPGTPVRFSPVGW